MAFPWHQKKKTCGPATTLSFAGIELDSISFEAHTITHFLARKKVTLKEIQSFIGILNFACAVVVPGRAFLHRLIDLTLGLKSPHHFVRLNQEVRSDLGVWQTFLASFNGRLFILDKTWYSSDKLNLFTDAAGGGGFRFWGHSRE